MCRQRPFLILPALLLMLPAAGQVPRPAEGDWHVAEEDERPTVIWLQEEEGGVILYFESTFGGMSSYRRKEREIEADEPPIEPEQEKAPKLREEDLEEGGDRRAEEDMDGDQVDQCSTGGYTTVRSKGQVERKILERVSVRLRESQGEDKNGDTSGEG